MYILKYNNYVYKQKKPIIISLGGNIGSGKSSIIHYLKHNFSNFCNIKNHDYKI